MKKPCKPYRSVLDALLDGVEDQASRAGLEAHSQGCEACQRAFDEAKRMRSMLDTLVDGQSTRIDDEAFVASVFAEVDAAPAPPAITARRAAKPLRLLLVGAAAAAAAAILAVQLSSPAIDAEPSGESARTAQEGTNPNVPQPAGRISADADAHAVTNLPVDVRDVEAGNAASQPAPQQELEPEPLTEADLQAFRLALVEAASRSEFDAAEANHGSPFAAALVSPVTDPRRAARRVLTLDSTPTAQVQTEAALAARFLGPRADARDRMLLKRSVESLGAAGAWALVDRGGPGLTTLWSLGLSGANDPKAPAAMEKGPGETARTVLFAAAKNGRLDLENLPRRRGDAALAAAVISAGSSDSTGQLLDMFLRSGELPWLDVWASEDGALASLESELTAPRNARGWDRRSSRLLEAIERAGAAGGTVGVDFAIRALKDNVEGSGRALASIAGPQPVLALFRATQSGDLRDSIEEGAWGLMARAGSGRILSSVFGDTFEAAGKAELLLDALVRGTSDTLHIEEQRILGGLGASAELYSEIRSGALLLLAEKCGKRGAKLLPELKQTITKLRGAADARVSAAAWLVPLRSAKTPPPHIAHVLSRSGSATVKHARLARAIEKARARVAQGSF